MRRRWCEAAMTAKDWVTLGLSLAALVLSVINFRRTTRTNERQYALSFTQDVARWAGEGLELFREIEAAGRRLGKEENAKWHEELLPRVHSLLNRGALLFPGTISYDEQIEASHPVLSIVAEFVNTVEKNRRWLAYNDRHGSFVPGIYSPVREKFLMSIQDEIRVGLRYQLASAAMAPKTEAGELFVRAMTAGRKNS